jgi:uncharacterized cupredoxin-like copper-binding protein
VAMSPRSFTFCTVLAGALTTAAGPARAQVTSAGERIQYARVVAKDYVFEAPTALREGIVTFHLTNQGSDLHQLSIVEVGVGHTIKQFFDAMRENGTPPAWAVTVGMTPTIQPNSEAFTTVRLTPGHYVLACMIPAKDGRSHVEKGMYQWVTVTARPAPPAPADRKKP